MYIGHNVLIWRFLCWWCLFRFFGFARQRWLSVNNIAGRNVRRSSYSQTLLGRNRMDNQI